MADLSFSTFCANAGAISHPGVILGFSEEEVQAIVYHDRLYVAENARWPKKRIMGSGLLISIFSATHKAFPEEMKSNNNARDSEEDSRVYNGIV